MPRPILCLDFDGVMHSYLSGWQGIAVCHDPPVAGLEAFLREALKHFDVAVYSSRSACQEGRAAMQAWCERWLAPGVTQYLHFPGDKPPAMVTLDDRALTFTGVWPDVDTLRAFTPWTWNTPPPNEQPEGAA